MENLIELLCGKIFIAWPDGTKQSLADVADLPTDLRDKLITLALKKWPGATLDCSALAERVAQDERQARSAAAALAVSSNGRNGHGGSR